MYFLWKNTSHGRIRVSSSGLREFADEVLRSKLRLYGITLHPSGRKDDAEMSIVLSEEDVTPETKKNVEKNFPAVLKPMGIKASVVWAAPERSIAVIARNPYVWAGAAVCTAVLVTAGTAGFFWAAFWGAAAWFGVYGLGLLFRRARNG
ncbi:MAG: hypothetical protein IJT02_05540 [Synergistaceae bacterium]|nr:hypothetical protein [Synergistaceae bacterium]